MLRELGRSCGSTALALSMHTHLVAATVRNAIGRQRTCFLFHVTSSGHGVADAQILFAHHRIFSSPRGRAQICAALDAGSKIPRNSVKPSGSAMSHHHSHDTTPPVAATQTERAVSRRG